jgi:hypothetical protein
LEEETTCCALNLNAKEVVDRARVLEGEFSIMVLMMQWTSALEEVMTMMSPTHRRRYTDSWPCREE